MKTIVIYKSLTGFTKKYAKWIAEELSADIFSAEEVNINKIAEYDTIIYGGSLYAVGIKGVKLITKNLDKLKDKNIIVFATGASPGDGNDLKKVEDKNFTLEQQKQIKFFYLRGGFDFSKLSFVDKKLMNVLKWKIQNKKEELTDEEKDLLAMFDKPVDFTSKENIREVVNAVKLLIL